MKRSFPHWVWSQAGMEERGLEDLLRAWEGNHRSSSDRSEYGSTFDKDFEFVANETSNKVEEKQEQSISEDRDENTQNRPSESYLVLHIVLKEYFKRPKEALAVFKQNSVAFHFNGSVYAATKDMLAHVQKCLNLLFPRGTLIVKFYKLANCSNKRLLFETELAHSPHPIELDDLVEMASKATEACR